MKPAIVKAFWGLCAEIAFALVLSGAGLLVSYLAR